jgi:hypothetical protein
VKHKKSIAEEGESLLSMNPLLQPHFFISCALHNMSTLYAIHGLFDGLDVLKAKAPVHDALSPMIRRREEGLRIFEEHHGGKEDWNVQHGVTCHPSANACAEDGEVGGRREADRW